MSKSSRLEKKFTARGSGRSLLLPRPWMAKKFPEV
jgi:hypothetical protein